MSQGCADINQGREMSCRPASPVVKRGEHWSEHREEAEEGGHGPLQGLVSHTNAASQNRSQESSHYNSLLEG